MAHLVLNDIDRPAGDGTSTDFSIESLVAKAQDALVGIFYLVSKETRQMYITAILSVLLESLQLWAFALPDPWMFETGVASTMKLTSEYLSYALFHRYIFGSNAMAGFATIVVIIAVLLGVSAFVGYAWVQQEIHTDWAARLLRKVVGLTIGVLYIPIVHHLASACNCEGPDCMPMKVGSSILLAIFVPYAIALRATFFSSSPGSTLPTARGHSRIAVFHQVLVTAIAVFSNFFEKTNISVNAARLWCLFIVATSALLCFLYIWLQPFYSRRMNTVYAVSMGIFAWLGMSMAVHVYFVLGSTNPNRSTGEAMLFSGIAMVIALVVLVLMMRRSRLVETDNDTPMHPFEIELKGRFILQPFVDAERNLERSKKHLAAIKSVSEMYANAVSQDAHSAMICILHANFLLNTMKQPLLARRALILAASRSPAIDARFIIFKTRKELEEQSFRANDVVAFVAREKYLKVAMMHDQRCCSLLIEFWNELAFPKPNDEKVRLLSDAIGTSQATAHSSYKKLLKLRGDDVRVIKMYSGFLSDIANDPETAEQMKLRWQHLQYQDAKKKRRLHRAASVTNLNLVASSAVDSSDLFDSSSAVLTIDADRSIGRIVAASAEGAQLFNQPSDFLIGKHISSILLPPFDDKFETMVRRYLEFGEDTYFNKTFQTYVRLSKGTVVQCLLNMRPFSADGMDFQVYVCIKETAPEYGEECCALVDPQTGKLFGVTEALREVFVKELPADQENDLVLVDSIVPDYFGRRDEFMEHAKGVKLYNAQAAIRKNPKLANCRVTVISTSIHSGSYTMDKVIFLELERDDEDKKFLGMDPSDLSELEIDDTLEEDDVNPYASSAASTPRTPRDDHGDRRALLRSPSNKRLSSRNSSRSSFGKDKSLKSKRSSKRMSKRQTSSNRGITRMTSIRFDETAKDGGTEDIKKKKKKKKKSKTGDGDGDGAESTATSQVTSAQLVRNFLSKQGQGLDPGLARFRILYFATVVVVLAMVITVYYIRSNEVFKFLEQLVFTNKADLRRFFAVTIAYMAHSLSLIANGIQLPSGVTEATARATLHNSAASLEAIESTLFANRFLFDDELRGMYENAFVELRSKQSGAETTNKHTLYDASAIISGIAQKAAQTPLSDLSDPDNALTYFLTNNIRPGSGDSESHLQALNKSTILFASQGVENITRMTIINAVLALVAILGILILLVLILLPLVNHLEQNKESVLEVLTAISGDTISKVRARYVERLTVVHSTDGSVADSANQGREGSGEENTEDGAAGGTPTVVSGTEAASDAVGHEKKRKSFATKSKWAMRRDKYFLFIRMGILVFICTAYFAVTLSLNYKVTAIMEPAPNEANYSGMRRMLSRSIMFHLRMMATGTSFGGYTVTDAATANLMYELKAAHEALLYGKTSHGVSGFLVGDDIDPEQESLLLMDGCIKWPATSPFTAEQCRSFQNGIMDAGLHTALLDFIKKAFAVKTSFLNRPTYTPSGAAAAVNTSLHLANYVSLSDMESRFLQNSLGNSVKMYGRYLNKQVTDSESKCLHRQKRIHVRG